jgi:hypothetical protein
MCISYQMLSWRLACMFNIHEKHFISILVINSLEVFYALIPSINLPHDFTLLDFNPTTPLFFSYIAKSYGTTTSHSHACHHTALFVPALCSRTTEPLPHAQVAAPRCRSAPASELPLVSPAYTRSYAPAGTVCCRRMKRKREGGGRERMMPRHGGEEKRV